MFDYEDQSHIPSPVMTPRIPPNDTEAELAVLSSMLFDREAINTAHEILRAEDFYRPDYAQIFETMIELYNRSIPVDAVTLSDKLYEKGMLEQIGGKDRIVDITNAYYTSANIKHHAKIVADKATLRGIINNAMNMVNAGYEGKEDAAVILERAEKSVFEMAQKTSTKDFAHAGDVILTTIEQLTKLAENPGAITGVPTGFIDFDRMTAGLQPADLIIVGARPSMGKTAFLLNLAQHAAIKNNITTAIFSLEMAKESLINRLISAEAGVDAGRLRIGNLKEDDWEKIAASVSDISNAPIYIDETSGITITEMRSKCRKLKIEKNLGLIVIDYLQLMGAPESSRPDNRQLEITEISRSLKAIAKELSVPVVVAAQLSRAVEARKDHRPMLSDLRESGAIEQDADLVTFLYRDEYYNPDTLKKNHAEVIIAKQRNGSTGTVELTFLGQYTRFVNQDKNFH